MTKKDDKCTLIELVENSKEKQPVIIGMLAENKLLDKYNEELFAKERGKINKIAPSITEDEFNKKIDKFLKKKV